MALLELRSPELLLLTPLFITLTLMGHYFAHRLKRSLEVFHYPPVKRLTRIAARRGPLRSQWRGISLASKLVIVVVLTFSLANPALLTFSEIGTTVEVPMVMKKDLTGQIILAIDTSASMGIKDVHPSRLEAAKSLLLEFVQNASENVKFGVVAFEREIVETLPLTENKSRIVSTIRDLPASTLMPCLEEFTDVGYGLQTSIDLLTPYAPFNRSSAIILVSDGFTNFGYPNPFESVYRATARADTMTIPIHALHIARMGQDSNDELMRQIAEETHAKFMASTSLEELKEVLNIIGKYYVPTHEWSSMIDIKTTLPVRIELGLVLMVVAAAFILMLWIGNYKHYKTAF